MQKLILAERKGNKCLCAKYPGFQVSRLFWPTKNMQVHFTLCSKDEDLAQVSEVQCFKLSSGSAGKSFTCCFNSRLLPEALFGLIPGMLF